MEVINSTILTTPQIFCHRGSIFYPKSVITSWRNPKPLKFKIPTSKFSLYHSSPLQTSFSNHRKIQISAQFGGPTSRRNSLRKKLTQQQEVRQNDPTVYHSHNQISFHNFDDVTPVDTLVANDIDGSDSLENSNLKSLGSDYVFWDQLGSWADQYKADSKFWGVGSGPIFTVYQDSDGKVKRVDINEDEILRRNQIEPLLYRQGKVEDFIEVSSKIFRARALAREIEIGGSSVIPKNSSVAKFIISSGKSGFVNAIRGVTLQPGLFRAVSRVGIAVFCGLLIFGALKMLFPAGKDKEEEYSSFEKEMMRRKIKARMAKENSVAGTVEVVQETKEVQIAPTEKPHLDKQDLMTSIRNSFVVETSGAQGVKPMDFGNRIEEIRAMAKHARELERIDTSSGVSDIRANSSMNDLSNEKNEIQQRDDTGLISQNDPLTGYSGETGGLNGTIKPLSVDDPRCDDTRSLGEVASLENRDALHLNNSKMEGGDGKTQNLKDRDYGSNISDTIEVSQTSETPDTSCKPKETSIRRKPRVIKSIKEAREYLSQRYDKPEQDQEPQVISVDASLSIPSEKEIDENTIQGSEKNDEISDYQISSRKSDLTYSPNASTDNSINRKEEGCQFIDLQTPGASLGHEEGSNSSAIQPSVVRLAGCKGTDSKSGERLDKDNKRTTPFSLERKSDTTSKGTVPIREEDSEDVEEGYGVIDSQVPMTSNRGSSGGSVDAVPPVSKESWIAKNFHELEPVVKKIGVGFRENYVVSKERIAQELNLNSEMILPKRDEDDGELDWMKDDRLREIVFQVRDNELTGKDPFYLMDEEDKRAFFEGLEKKVEKENEKLQNLHQWVHSNIENLDYGADGISLYDPPEKIIPRWKGPPVDTRPEFLNEFAEQRQALVTENPRNSDLLKRDQLDSLQDSEESPSQENTSSTSLAFTQNTKLHGGISKTPRTVIESSDGSVRAGKKSGKEYWQHTKKWSRGFLESYNTEQDPKTKAVMKDIGKDLDRWITEKEIQEAADLMDKLPERGQILIEEKLSKVKREMEVFGPQAVMSKYSEYAEEKEEDYLWWLDLPFVLCIEIYTIADGDQKVGFYSLEMAPDLELNPKPYHVIAFENAVDCKNLCYIIQAHMEMLGNGSAFVVSQPPKDAFREAKANGFGVTVIRKGELHLNVDQTLEEVEEQITEIGSKMYHDKIMKGRSVDISSLMKGVFGVSKPKRRRKSKRKLKKPIQQ